MRWYQYILILEHFPEDNFTRWFTYQEIVYKITWNISLVAQWYFQWFRFTSTKLLPCFSDINPVTDIWKSIHMAFLFPNVAPLYRPSVDHSGSDDLSLEIQIPYQMYYIIDGCWSLVHALYNQEPQKIYKRCYNLHTDFRIRLYIKIILISQ